MLAVASAQNSAYRHTLAKSYMMKRSEIFFSAVLVPLDYIMVMLAGLTAYFLRFQTALTDIRPAIYTFPFSTFLSWLAAISVLFILVNAVARLYTMRGTRRVQDEIRRIFFSTSTSVLILIVAVFFQRELFSSRFIMLAGWLLAFVYLLTARLIVLYIVRALFKRGWGLRSVIIIGDDATTKTLQEGFQKQPKLGYAVIAHFTGKEIDLLASLGELTKQQAVDEILQADAHLPKNTALALLDFAEESHIVFKYSADLFTAHSQRMEIEMLGGTPIIEMRRTPLEGWGRIFKRLFDIVVSALLLIIFSPLMLLEALAIWAETGGPIFWSRLDNGSPVMRVGQGGELFHYFKFRSMRPNSHDLRYTTLAKENFREGPLVKIKDDPRITKVGHFIRKYSLDELIELWLVLKGDMSLVGPRPHLPEEVTHYSHHHKGVLTLKPGITGLAQISGRSDLDFDEEVRLDTYYIEHWSLLFDIYILLKTPLVVLSARQAV